MKEVWLAKGLYHAGIIDDPSDAEAWAREHDEFGFRAEKDLHLIPEDLANKIVNKMKYAEHLEDEANEQREQAKMMTENADKFAYFIDGLNARGIKWWIENGKIMVKACVFGHNNTYDYGENPPDEYECTVDDDFLRELLEYEHFAPEDCGNCCGCGDW